MAHNLERYDSYGFKSTRVDGSTMNSSYIDRRFNLPSHVVNVPLRYTEEEVQKYAVTRLNLASDLSRNRQAKSLTGTHIFPL